MRHILPRADRSLQPRCLPLLAGIILSAAGPTMANDATPATAPSATVLEPVHAFFDAMARHDQATMRAQVLPAGTATLMRKGKPVPMTLGDFVDHVKPGKERIEERLGRPQVLVDHELAVVWAPYTFLLEGRPHHCGTDAFNLVRVDGRWRITAIADNSRECKPWKASDHQSP